MQFDTLLLTYSHRHYTLRGSPTFAIISYTTCFERQQWFGNIFEKWVQDFCKFEDA